MRQPLVADCEDSARARRTGNWAAMANTFCGDHHGEGTLVQIVHGKAPGHRDDVSCDASSSAGFLHDIGPAWSHCRLMRRLIPLLLLAVLAAAGFFLAREVGWDGLARHQAVLQDWVRTYPVASAALYLVAYTATAALSLPNAAILTVAGGLLYGPVLGCILTVVGATLGASLLLVIVRSAFAETLSRHSHRIPATVRTRLSSDGFSYLLALRFVPLFPFWVVNLAAAVAGIRLRVFVPATLLGVAPASFVLSSIGAGVSALLADGKTPDLSVLFAPRLLLPLAGLAVLSLLPALFRRRPGAHA
jgi:uncharacterized membrane protein YdjX (TVP38/TMEM64 family)